ncbi:GMC oxidoreductase [Streptomyces sp. NPDC006872]|uniref:GMC oxidoreductase n=1 Tax=Streptomyces sp. NPDC006872 TaxID=3155720 RepID=UPI0034017F79
MHAATIQSVRVKRCSPHASRTLCPRPHRGGRRSACCAVTRSVVDSGPSLLLIETGSRDDKPAAARSQQIQRPQPHDPYPRAPLRLSALGVARLRVVDSSVMPTITSGNTRASAVVIGERCANVVLTAKN